MAATSPILALDIGSHTVKFGEFTATKEGALTLHRFGTAPLGLDPNKDENRYAAVTAALRQVTGKATKSGQTFFSLAGHAVFMRGVKLPPVDAMQLDQMIAFEAQQIVPFPLSEVVWDFLTLSGSGSEKEAIIVAVKTDLLESEYSAVRGAGLQPSLVDVGPLALYNAYRYNYTPTDHCVLLVDIGARSTNLLFIEGDRLYTRILPLAGNTITQTICNEFQEPFSVAEKLKIERGGVHLGGGYAQPDDRDSARLWKLGRTLLGKIQTEINRSIIFYRNQQGGSAPQQIYLTGGTSRLPYLDHFLAEKFSVPVEFFNPLRNVTLGGGLDRNGLSLAGHAFGEVVGLALRGTGPTPAAISLKPKSVSESEKNKKQGPVVGAALFALALLFAVPALAIYLKMGAVEETGQALGGKIAGLKKAADAVIPLEKESDDLQRRFKAADRVLEQRDQWLRFMNTVNGKLPVGVWITQFTPTSNGQSPDAEGGDVPAPKGKKPGKGPQLTQVEINGICEKDLTLGTLTDFVRSLAETGLFDLKPDQASNAIVKGDPTEGSTQLGWSFVLSLKLKNPIDLAP
ncbi:type IV pilus assembly protein PilM [Verrucomicrobium sp. GAS474]|uniref:type IV pilus assembly protein PilM n=1 Tax=Verrucomicrobium sp. GAS474 TaxID=1882831 RepID=UPI00087AA767|nr:type IV pilus assembly protein PilM [Verrucomicrobium sp. GAS474]SDU10314.1 type IV pilus assembly protein PilM [Verrucomicrobium sp. GAS474]